MKKLTKKEIKALERLDALKAYAERENVVTIAGGALVDALNHGGDYSAEMYALASILVHCKINRVQKDEKTYHPMHTQVKNQVTALHGGTLIQTLIDGMNKLYTTRVNNDGDVVTVCTDAKQASATWDRIVDLSTANSDGMNLLHDAVLAIMKALRVCEQKASGEKIERAALVTPFPVVGMDGNVKRYTTHVNEIMRAITKSIHDNKSVRDTEKLVDAVEILSDTAEDGTPSYVIKYVPAYKVACEDIYMGDTVVQCVNTETQELAKKLMRTVELKSFERKVLKMRLDNKSIQEIVFALDCSESTVRRAMTRIQEATKKSGVLDCSRVTNGAEFIQSRAIVAYKDGKKWGVYDSITAAAADLNLSKSKISECVNGKRKTTGGYTFTTVTLSTTNDDEDAPVITRK